MVRKDDFDTVVMRNSNRLTSPRKKVALIHPPAVSKRYLRTKFMPYGMAVIYAFLKEHHVPVVQYDFLMDYLFNSPHDINFHSHDNTFSQEEFFSHLNGGKAHSGLEAFTTKYGQRLPPDACLYGFSIVAYHQFWASLLLAKYVRKMNPQAVIVFGGPFITIRPLESLVPFGQADYWIKGSGELPLLHLYRLLSGETNLSVEEIPGIIFKKGDLIHQSPKSTLSAEEERAPDFEGLALREYQYDHPVTGTSTLFIPYRLSKGCPSRCNFCTGRLVDTYGCKSPSKIASELAYLSEKYHSSNFQFADASINGNPKQLSEVCRTLRDSLPNIRWYAYAKVAGFDKRLLLQCKEAGCISLFWGIESASQTTIDLLGKGFLVEKMYELLDYSISIGITNFVHLIYNTPHESTKDIEALEALISKYVACPKVVFLPQRFILEPQSRLFEQPDSFGLRNLTPVTTSLFEREEYAYSEVEGLDAAEVLARNRQHSARLSRSLELIRVMEWKRSADGFLPRIFPSRFLLRLVRYSQNGKVANKFLHNITRRFVERTNQPLREQL